MLISPFRLIKLLITLFCFFFAVSSTTSCAAKRKPINEHNYPEIAFNLEDGETKKEAIIQHFGNPYRIFENGRIIIFYLQKKKDWARGSPFGGGNYHLVLVFSEQNVLERHSLVRVE